MTECIFLFPGQGSQSAGMGKELSENFASARAIFEAADAALGFSLSALCFSGPEEDLTLTPNAQPAVTAVNLAVFSVLAEKGAVPVATAGHSLGEYAADCAAGVFSAGDAIRLTRRRGELMQECADKRPGSMVAVLGLPMGAVRDVCGRVAAESGGVVSVANFNSPEQVVITGESEPVAKAAGALEAEGAKRTVELKVSGPWHSALMEDAQAAFEEVLAGVEFSSPAIPLYANVDALKKSDGQAVRRALLEQITGSVRWVQIIESMRKEFPDAVFLECGPGKVLKGLLRAIDREAVCYSIECGRSLEKALEKIGA